MADNKKMQQQQQTTKTDSMQMDINGKTYYIVQHPFDKKGSTVMLPLDVAGKILNLQQENKQLKEKLAVFQRKESNEQANNLQFALRGRRFCNYGADEDENEVDRQTLFDEFCDNFYDRFDLTDDNGKEIKVTNEQLNEQFKQKYGIN